MVEQTDTGWLFLTSSSHSRKGRITRGRTHSTYLIGGSQTVQHHQHSRTCCVQCWPTHPTLARLIVYLASSMQLTTTIRNRHTPTIEGQGEEWVRGLGAVEQIRYASRYTRSRKQRSFCATSEVALSVVRGTEKTNNNGMTGERPEQHWSALLKG